MARRVLLEICLAAFSVALATLLVLWVVRSGGLAPLFAWPRGSIWPSIISWAVDASAIAIVIWFFRDRIGPRIVAWWHVHAEPHLLDQVGRANSEMHEMLNGRLNALHSVISELQEHVSNGLLNDLHNHVEAVSTQLHARLDVIEPHLGAQDEHLTQQDAMTLQMHERLAVIEAQVTNGGVEAGGRG